MDPRLRESYSRCSREVDRGLLPDLVNGRYDYLVVDYSSIAYGLKSPRSFLVNIRLALDYGYLRPKVIFVLDYSRPMHREVVESRLWWFKGLGLEDEPAEVRAAKLCLVLGRCVVLSRDYDVLTIMDYMIQPLKISERAWLVRLVLIDRSCLGA